MGPIPTTLQLFGTIREAYKVTRALVHAVDESQPMLLNHVLQCIKLIATLKRRSVTSFIAW